MEKERRESGEEIKKRKRDGSTKVRRKEERKEEREEEKKEETDVSCEQKTTTQKRR